MKTTKDNFIFFKSQCKYWQTVLGLLSWRIYFSHANCPKDHLADCSTGFEGRVATIRLNTNWKNIEVTQDELNICALHECLEILLSPLFAIAKSRNYDASEYEKEHHSVIRVLEKLLMKQCFRRG